MWGQKWAQMMWGQPGQPGQAVPGVGPWLLLLLGAALGIAAYRSLRHARPRTIALTLFGLALALPVTARAVTLITFTNGTVADAAQVNANFAALNPIDGYYASNAVPASGTIGPETDIVATTFVAPRNLTCVSYAESTLFAAAPGSITGNARMDATASRNGAINYSYTPPRSAVISTFYTYEISPQWRSTQVRSFPVLAGETVGFGCHTSLNGGFLSATQLTCTVIYNCH